MFTIWDFIENLIYYRVQFGDDLNLTNKIQKLKSESTGNGQISKDLLLIWFKYAIKTGFTFIKC